MGGTAGAEAFALSWRLLPWHGGAWQLPCSLGVSAGWVAPLSWYRSYRAPFSPGVLSHFY